MGDFDRNEIYELVKRTPDLVVIKVKDVDNLTKACHPEMPTCEYVSVTRGRNHIMTFINKDGSSWSISWGDSGCTMCSDSLRATKWDIVHFIEDDCGILLDLKDDDIVKASIFYNNNFKKWELSVRDSGNHESFYMNALATNAGDMMEIAEEKFGIVCDWIKGIAETGITHWVANI